MSLPEHLVPSRTDYPDARVGTTHHKEATMATGTRRRPLHAQQKIDAKAAATKARRPITLMVGSLAGDLDVLGDFVWTPNSLGHGRCGHCSAPAGTPCLAHTRSSLRAAHLSDDEPFVHAGRASIRAST